MEAQWASEMSELSVMTRITSIELVYLYSGATPELCTAYLFWMAWNSPSPLYTTIGSDLAVCQSSLCWNNACSVCHYSVCCRTQQLPDHICSRVLKYIDIATHVHMYRDAMHIESSVC